MKRKHLGPILFILILAGGLVALLLMLWGLSTFKTGGNILASLGEPPVVEIAQPADGTLIASGRGVIVAAVAQSDAGLARVDFLADGVVTQQYILDAPGEQAAVAAFPWFGSQTGWHELSVVAYDINGRASDAAVVRVGVQALASLPEIEIISSDDPDRPLVGEAVPPGDDAPVEGGQPPHADADAQAPLDGGAQPADPDQALPEIPPQPQDAPPDIIHFDLAMDVVNDPMDPEMAMTVSLSGAAVDDLGLERLVVNWSSDSGLERDFTQECAGAQGCELQLAGAISEGRWVFALQAFDTSGQASVPAIEMVEVMGEPGQPPAAADHEIDEDWLREHLGAAQEQFDLGEVELPGVPGFDVDEFIRNMFGDRERPDIAERQDEADSAQAEGHCANMGVEPHPDGNLITLTVMCDIKVEGEGQFVLPYAGKYLVNTGDGGITLFVREWYDNTRTRIAAGETFTWVDWDVTCGTPYRYQVRVGSAMETDNGLATGEVFALAQAEATTPACTPGSIGAVNLSVEARPEDMRVSWLIAGGGNWPEDLPDEGVTFLLLRYESVSGQAEEIYRENVPTDLLLAGGGFEVIDAQIQCGVEYIYSLSAIAADADLGLVSPGWLLRAQVPGQSPRCPEDDLGSIELNLTPYWFDSSIVRTRIQMFIPPGFAWPDGDQAALEILRIQQGADRCEGPPCRGIWQAKKRIPITDDIRLNGMAFEDDDTSVDLRWHETYVYRLALIVDNVEVQSGPSFSATMPPAPPPPPEIARMTVTNNCPGAAARCVIIEWQPYEQPIEGGYYAQAETIAVERVVGNLDRQLFPVNIADTRFVDSNPFMSEIELMNGEVRRICHYDTIYRMVAFDAGGHTYGASPLSTVMPGCDEPWNIVIEPRQR